MAAAVTSQSFLLSPTNLHLNNQNHFAPLRPLNQPLLQQRFRIPTQTLLLRNGKPSTLNPIPKFRFRSALLPENPPSQNHLISSSTRTLASFFALACSLASAITKLSIKVALKMKTLCTLTAQDLETFPYLQDSVLCTVGPLFFAAVKDRPSGVLNTPLTVVAAGMAKWLDIYSGVLMVRVLLSWFPNIPWDRQPLSAIRDLCDPYLNLFRNIIPPIFDTLDISPLLAFAVLGTLASILNSSKGF